MNWTAALPELVLVAGSMALLMLGVFLKQDRARLISWLAVAVIVIAMVLVFRTASASS